MSTAQKNAPSSKGVLGNLVTLINRVGDAVNRFLGTVNGPNVPVCDIFSTRRYVLYSDTYCRPKMPTSSSPATANYKVLSRMPHRFRFGHSPFALFTYFIYDTVLPGLLLEADVLLRSRNAAVL